MKTNPFARCLVRIRVLLLCVSLVGILGLEFYLVPGFARRIGQVSESQMSGPVTPPMDLADLMAAAP